MDQGIVPYRFLEGVATSLSYSQGNTAQKGTWPQSPLSTKQKQSNNTPFENLNVLNDSEKKVTSYQPKVYLHKMGKRIESNHHLGNLIFNSPGKRFQVSKHLGNEHDGPTKEGNGYHKLSKGIFISLKDSLLERLGQLLKYSRYFSLTDFLSRMTKARLPNC